MPITIPPFQAVFVQSAGLTAPPILAPPNPHPNPSPDLEGSNKLTSNNATYVADASNAIATIVWIGCALARFDNGVNKGVKGSGKPLGGADGRR